MDKIKYCEKCKYIVGTTSLWLMIPVYISLFNFYKKKHNELYLYVLSFTMITICIVSTLMWKDRNESLILFYVDMFFAKSLFILLLLITVYIKFDDLNIYRISFPILIILFYLLSIYFYNKNKINIATIFHLLFRYVGFLWCCILVNYPYMFLYPLSIIYFTLIFYEWNYINYINNKHVNKFTCNLYYKSGCINLIKIMFMIILLHTIYEYNKHYLLNK